MSYHIYIYIYIYIYKDLSKVTHVSSTTIGSEPEIVKLGCSFIELNIVDESEKKNEFFLTWSVKQKKNKVCFEWFGLVLWHINLCRFFNTKSIFM